MKCERGGMGRHRRAPFRAWVEIEWAVPGCSRLSGYIGSGHCARGFVHLPKQCVETVMVSFSRKLPPLLEFLPGIPVEIVSVLGSTLRGSKCVAVSGFPDRQATRPGISAVLAIGVFLA